jgi:hypothetical protein
MKITANNNSRSYVIQNSGFTTTLGFDVVADNIKAMAQRMGVSQPSLEVGSVDAYQVYQEMLTKFGQHSASNRTWFTPGTDAKVQKVLSKARDNSALIRIFYGNVITGHDWCEEESTVGFVGRSTGVFKVPLLLEAYQTSPTTIESASYGDSILTHCIVRIIDVSSQEELFRTTNYRTPEFKIVRTTPDLCKLSLFFGVDRLDTDDKRPCRLANVKSEYEAQRYVAFMQGLQLLKPLRTRAQANADITFT